MTKPTPSAPLSAPSPAGGEAFQQRVQPWMMACFGAEISADVVERNHRFLEEALELVQSTGCTASEAHQLVDYVFGREIGETHQEIGGVMVTLAALCLALGEDMHAAGETELARIWTKVEKIRTKQAAKPKHSPLPECPAAELGIITSPATPEPASAPAGEAVRDRLRAAVLRGAADEVNGKPYGNIITKGCEAAEYVDPDDATGAFVDAIVDEAIATLSGSKMRFPFAWAWQDGDLVWQATCDEDKAHHSARVKGYEVIDLYRDAALNPAPGHGEGEL